MYTCIHYDVYIKIKYIFKCVHVNIKNNNISNV